MFETKPKASTFGALSGSYALILRKYLFPAAMQDGHSDRFMYPEVARAIAIRMTIVVTETILSCAITGSVRLNCFSRYDSFRGTLSAQIPIVGCFPYQLKRALRRNSFVL